MIKELILLTYGCLLLTNSYGLGPKNMNKQNLKPSRIEQIISSNDPKENELNMSFDPDDCCGSTGNPDDEKNNSPYLEDKEWI